MYYNVFTDKILNNLQTKELLTSIFHKHQPEQIAKTKTCSTSQFPSLYNKTGNYKLTCNDCPKCYIEQSGRSYNNRFKEHNPKNTIHQKSIDTEQLINSVPQLF